MIKHVMSKMFGYESVNFLSRKQHRTIFSLCVDKVFQSVVFLMCLLFLTVDKGMDFYDRRLSTYNKMLKSK